MTLQQIISFVNFVIRKAQAGDIMTPEQYNTLLASFNIEIFNSELEKAEVAARAQNMDIYRIIETTGALPRFTKKVTLNTSGGYVSLPADYVIKLGLIAKYNNSWRPMEVITEYEMNSRRGSMLETPLDIIPAASIFGGNINVYPKDVGEAPSGIELAYLRLPATPVYDYCMKESTGMYYYMPARSYIRTSGSLNNLYDYAGLLIQSDVTHMSKVAGTDYTSKTVELDWDDRFHMRFAAAILRAVAPSLDPNLLNEYAKEVNK